MILSIKRRYQFYECVNNATLQTMLNKQPYKEHFGASKHDGICFC